MPRTTILILAITTLAGCANTHDARRSAAPTSCESCGTPKKSTLLEKLGFGRPRGMTDGGTAPMPMEMPLPSGTIGAGTVPDASPSLNVEPAGAEKPQAQAKEVKGMKPKFEKPREPQARLRYA